MKKQGKVIIFSTHSMETAEKLCDHIVMIDKGKLILKGSLAEIKSKYSQRNVSLICDGDISFLNGNPIVEKISNFGNTTGIRVKESGHSQQLLKLLVDNNVIIKKFDANDISLHEIFLELAGRENGKEAANV